MAFYSIAFFLFVSLFVLLHESVGRLSPDRQWYVRLLAGITFFVYVSGARIVFICISALSIWGGALLITGLSDNYRSLRKREDISKEEKAVSKKRCARSRRIIMWSVTALNLAILVTLKYLLTKA